MARHHLALRLNPRSSSPYVHLAILHAERDQAREAVENVLATVRINARSMYSYQYLLDLFLRGRALECGENLAALLDLLEKELPKLDGALEFSVLSTLALGSLHAVRGEGDGACDRARAWAERCVAESEGRHPEMHLVAGRTLLGCCRREEAWAHLEEAYRLLVVALTSKEEGSGSLEFSPPLGSIAIRLPQRLAETLRDVGDAARAVELLRHLLAYDPNSPADLWNLWISLCFVELGESAAVLLAELPGSSRDGPGAETTAPALWSYRLEVEWLLSALSAGETVRLDAGKDDQEDQFGRARSFQEVVPRIAYRVPLPPGRYRVALEIARSGNGLMGIKAEEQSIAALSTSVTTDSGLAATVRVEDGILEIELGDDMDTVPAVSAIEIGRIE